jgi:hypothetical protein
MQTIEQRSAALRVAEATRLGRAEVKRKLRAGDAAIAEALVDPCCQKARVWTLICAHHGVGDATATKLLARLQIGPGRRVCDLTERQRLLVAAAIRSLSLRRAA